MSVIPTPALWVAFIIGGGGGWCVVVPLLLRVRHPHLAERNPDHFRRTVWFHRTWGVAAVIVGLATSAVL